MLHYLRLLNFPLTPHFEKTKQNKTKLAPVLELKTSKSILMQASIIPATMSFNSVRSDRQPHHWASLNWPHLLQSYTLIGRMNRQK